MRLPDGVRARGRAHWLVALWLVALLIVAAFITGWVFATALYIARSTDIYRKGYFNGYRDRTADEPPPRDVTQDAVQPRADGKR